MSIILLNLFLGNSFNLNIIFLFTIVHTLLSSLFFFLVDIIYKRYNSRLVFNIKGLFKNNLNLSTNILFSLLVYNGFPISIKFLVELYFLINLFNTNYFFIFLVLNILNFFSILGFSKI
jgi:formate hydrogenlyase subunit 3/multisubunit Na+/H+ antiporter MnhD subunit